MFFALILNFVIVHDVNYINKNAALLQPINISGIDEVRYARQKFVQIARLKAVNRVRVKIKSIAKRPFVGCCKEALNSLLGTN